MMEVFWASAEWHERNEAASLWREYNPSGWVEGFATEDERDDYVLEDPDGFMNPCTREEAIAYAGVECVADYERFVASASYVPYYWREN